MMLLINAYVKPRLAESSHLQDDIATNKTRVAEDNLFAQQSRSNMDISEEKQNARLGRWLSS